MKKTRTCANVLRTLVLWGVLLAGGHGTAGDAWNQGGQVTCVQWKSEVRYSGYGYDHLVHLDNQCDHAVTCHVTTDVNPEGVKESLKPKAKATVLTMRGSPAREFKAKVSCQKK